MEEGYFQLVVHHSGTFCDARYAGGDTSTWSCDGDRWSYFEIVGILKEMGFITVQEMRYSRGGCEELENRLEVLVDDGAAIEMLKIANTHGEVHLVIVHVVSEAKMMLVLGDGVDGGGVEPTGVEADVEDGGGVEPTGVETDVEDDGGVELTGVESDVEDGGGVEPEGFESDVEDGGGVEPEGLEDQGIGTPIHEDMESDDDGGHVLEDSSSLREVEFIEGQIEVQSEGPRDKGQGDGEGLGQGQGLGFNLEVRHGRRSKRQTSNPIESLEPNFTDDLQDLGGDDDESEGTFVHVRGLSDTKWES